MRMSVYREPGGAEIYLKRGPAAEQRASQSDTVYLDLPGRYA